MFETLNSQRQSLKEASIKLIQTAVTLQASIKQILEQDTGFGQSWESSLTEATAEIQGLSKAAGTELEGFLKGEDGGWNRAVKKTTKGIKKLLKEVDDDKTKVKDEY